MVAGGGGGGGDVRLEPASILASSLQQGSWLFQLPALTQCNSLFLNLVETGSSGWKWEGGGVGGGRKKGKSPSVQ